MQYLIALVLAVSLSFGVAILPSFADSGVSVTLTTTVVGNGGGGSGGFDPGDGPVPYTPPNWGAQFPSIGTQPQSSAPSDSRTIQQNPPIYIPPVVPQSNSYTPLPITPVQEPSDSSKDNMVYVFIGLAAILIGLILYLIIPDQKVR
jgi:hypothetical protein